MLRLRRQTGVWLCAAWWAGMGVVQAEGVLDEAARAPQRIVSLLPSATEAVCALGACDRLVGVDAFSQDPPQVRQLPQLGRTWQPDIEAIVRLRPDVVLTGRAPQVQQRLQAAGLRVVEVDATSIEQVRVALDKIDALLQQHRAPALWTQLQAHVDQLAHAVTAARQGAPAPRVYLEVDAALYAAGPHSFMGQLLARLGAGNIAPAERNAFPRLSPEWVLRADPDLIIQTHGAQLRELAQRPGWSRLRALQNGRVCRLNPEDSRVLTRPGPRLDVAAAVLARCLRDDSSRTPK